MLPGKERRFVIVSGLPGSGKSTTASKLAPWLGLPVIDKDDILERLFDAKGVGDRAWRRTLSRESDRLFRQDSEVSSGAILVSFWHLPGMPADTGTPTAWLAALPGRTVHLLCSCPSAIAATRYRRRTRHAGHLDSAKTEEEIRSSIAALEKLEPLQLTPRVTVDTTAAIDFAALAAELTRHLAGCPPDPHATPGEPESRPRSPQ